MKFISALLFLSFISFAALCQSFYVNNDSGQLYHVTITGNGLSSTLVSTCSGTQFSSIAFYKNTLYYTYAGSMNKGTFTNSNTLNNCTYIGNVTATPSLTADQDGLLYTTVSTHIYTYNPTTEAYIDKGDSNFTPAGDLMFYKGDLYMAASGGIVKIKNGDPAQSSLVINTGANQIWGLTGVYTATGDIKPLAFALSGGNSTQVMELDLEHNTLGNVIGTLPYTVYDAASDVETGTAPVLEISDFQLTSDCPFTGNGTVRIIVSPLGNGYIYKLNGQTNNTGVFTNVSPGTYTVEVTGSNNQQASKQLVITAFVLPKPTLTVETVRPMCLKKGSIKLSAVMDANLYHLQYNGALYDVGHLFNGLGPGNYHFDVLNLNGCKVDEQNIELVAEDCKINIDSIAIHQQCDHPDKGYVQVAASPVNDNYTFTLNGATNTTGLFENLSPGGYTLQITSAAIGSEQHNIVVPAYGKQQIGLTFTGKDAGCHIKGDIEFATTQNASRYRLKLNGQIFNLDYRFTNLDAGAYYFTILKPDNCILDTLTINVRDKGCSVVGFPNAFSPNSDGINDVFQPTVFTSAEQYQIKVYSRSGQLLFTSTDVAKGWDGTQNGRPMPAGVYYWLVNYRDTDRRAAAQSGYVALIR